MATVRPLRSRNPAVRTGLTLLGVLVIIVSPIIGAIPGPGGIFVFAAGLALVLQNSALAKRLFVRAKRRWPRIGEIADFGLRRASAQRRFERDRPIGADGQKLSRGAALWASLRRSFRDGDRPGTHDC